MALGVCKLDFRRETEVLDRESEISGHVTQSLLFGGARPQITCPEQLKSRPPGAT